MRTIRPPRASWQAGNKILKRRSTGTEIVLMRLALPYPAQNVRIISPLSRGKFKTQPSPAWKALMQAYAYDPSA